ncbi:MAG: MFS transporter [Caldilineaceae bacterium]|nr:MFS transporter [Caldilineaceae bacterium]
MRAETIQTPAAEAQGFQTGEVMTVAGGHFVHDSFSAFLSPLLPLIQERLGTSYAATGGLSIFLQLPSLLNPFLGYAADRISLRYFIILAPGITATLSSSLGLVHSYFALALLLLAAGVSVAAFHAPAPAMIGRISGQRVGTGMSIFMASGELGRTVGPLLVSAAVIWWGLEGIWRLAILGWLCSAVLYWRLRNLSARPVTTGGSLAALWPRVRQVYPAILWILTTKAFIAVALTTYLPIFMSDTKNASLWLAAASLTVLEAAGVVGALATGTYSDKWGRRRVLALLYILAPFVLFGFLAAPEPLLFPLLLGLGLTAISPTPVMMALVQDYFPRNRALANGIFLTANFLTRALAIWVVGWLADNFGLQTAFLWSGVIGLTTVAGLWMLPKNVAVTG